MITINKNIQSEILMTTMEEIVPEDSLFRKIDKYIDFTFIYDKVKDLYCDNNGRPSIDPVVLFKIVFIQALDGLKSMRQTCKKIKVDAEYRWFLGIPFGIDTPHFSTFSKNYERRFKDSDIFEEIFVEIVNQAIKYNLVDGTTFYTDSTHKKANANKNKYDDEIITGIKERRKWLEKEINEERIKQGRKPFEYKDKLEEKHIKVSTTDKESGYYHRDNKEKGFMYLDHRTVDDKCNIIVDTYITKGNVHDSVPFIDRAEYIRHKFGFDIKKYGVDSGYLTLDIKKYFIENNIFGVFGYRRYGTPDSRKEKSKYEYVKELDIYCEKETGEVLEYKGLIDKNGYKKYENIDKTKVVIRHIHEEWNEIFKNIGSEWTKVPEGWLICGRFELKDENDIIEDFITMNTLKPLNDLKFNNIVFGNTMNSEGGVGTIFLDFRTTPSSPTLKIRNKNGGVLHYFSIIVPTNVIKEYS